MSRLHSRSTTWAFAFVAAVSLASLTGALVTQHVFGMRPCTWCIFIRLVFVALGLIGLAGVLWQRGRGWLAALVQVTAATGLASALWLHLVASHSNSCKLTLADKVLDVLGLAQALPSVFEAQATCADGAVDLLGLAYPLWAAAAFVLCSLVLTSALFRRSVPSSGLTRG